MLARTWRGVARNSVRMPPTAARAAGPLDAAETAAERSGEAGKTAASQAASQRLEEALMAAAAAAVAAADMDIDDALLRIISAPPVQSHRRAWSERASMSMDGTRRA